ncbi:alkyl/aryl-sulfatase [Thalassovita sp.]|uniref:alkyl/aryl-sulfatase n=1 Tax=Thalassovita sp. TaxID=1979401 RepID=UPI0029DE5274|nr:alkyl sulfatase dimerization domain-containing protein [Thalassovita sp.]
MCQNPASAHTAAANRAVLDLLNFGDRQDFEDATRGFVATFDEEAITKENGDVVFDLNRYAFMEGDAPDSVNPSLWRQGQLNAIHGLFTIHPRIHQVRNADISNMTLIEGDSGWIIIDPLLTIETARAALALANKHLGERPVVAVIYTHSHADHFGGVRGVVDGADVSAGKIPIIAPDGFMEYAISENVLAGNAMNRRAQYQFGMGLEAGPTGHASCGLGPVLGAGTISLIAPTDTVYKTGESRIVDGVKIEFQMANGSEAPSEFMFYFPQFKALCASEVTTHNMHNILTPRGAEIRNTLGWAKYIDESIALFADRTDVIFASHHWPQWGTERIRGFLTRQRDLYRFIHDETLRLANHGYTINEIPDMVTLPEGLRHDFACRGYYGTLKHNIKAVYQFYLGWWDGNPSTYDTLPPEQSAKRLVRAMGGADAVLAEGRRAYDEGDYRWATEILNKLVFAEPDNAAARELQAATLEQMGYQAEAGTWRNLFLLGAQELREGVRPSEVNTVNPDVLFNMGVGMALDFLGVKFNASKASGDFTLLLDFTDKDESHLLAAQNGVLANTTYHDGKADLTLHLTEVAFFKLLGQIAGVEELAKDGMLSLEGDATKLTALFGAMDSFDPNFAIVTP